MNRRTFLSFEPWDSSWQLAQYTGPNIRTALAPSLILRHALPLYDRRLCALHFAVEHTDALAHGDQLADPKTLRRLI